MYIKTQYQFYKVVLSSFIFSMTFLHQSGAEHAQNINNTINNVTV